MSDSNGPVDSWEVAPSRDGAAAATSAPPPPPTKKSRKAKPKSVASDTDTEAVTKDIAQAIDGITDQINGIQTGLARKMSHLSVDAQAWSSALGDLVRKAAAVPMTVAMKGVLVPLRFVNGLLGKVAPDSSDEDGDDEEGIDWDAETGDEVPDIPLADFNDLIAKNIIFLDNSKRPIFTAASAGIGGKFSKPVQELYMELCLAAVRECAPMTNGMPPVDKGIHTGRYLEDLMTDVHPDDIRRFFTFACKFSGSYSGKNFRISETFATWLMNGSPVE